MKFFYRKILKSIILKNKYSSIYGRDTGGENPTKNEKKKKLREREKEKERNNLFYMGNICVECEWVANL